MPVSTSPTPSVRSLAAAALAALLAACGGEAEPSTHAPESAAASSRAPATAEQASAEGGPPLGRYVCRQGLTTMGYLALHPGGEYEVSGVRGRFRYDPASGAMNWEGGSYDEWGWDGTYEHVARPQDDGRPDEDVIRIVSESDGLKIDCFKMAEG